MKTWFVFWFFTVLKKLLRVEDVKKWYLPLEILIVMIRISELVDLLDIWELFLLIKLTVCVLLSMSTISMSQ